MYRFCIRRGLSCLKNHPQITLFVVLYYSHQARVWIFLPAEIEAWLSQKVCIWYVWFIFPQNCLHPSVVSWCVLHASMRYTHSSKLLLLEITCELAWLKPRLVCLNENCQERWEWRVCRHPYSWCFQGNLSELFISFNFRSCWLWFVCLGNAALEPQNNHVLPPLYGIIKNNIEEKLFWDCMKVGLVAVPWIFVLGFGC